MKNVAKTILVIAFIRAYEHSLEVFTDYSPDRKIHQVP
jgi:hypothetical protein